MIRLLPVLLFLASAATSCHMPTRTVVRLARVPRPERPEFPRQCIIQAEADGITWGAGQLEFGFAGRDKVTAWAERRAFDDLDGIRVYVLEAVPQDELMVRLLGYIQALEEQPVWEKKR